MVKFTDNKLPDFCYIEDAFPYGRLVDPGYDFPEIRARDVYDRSLELGRPLTDVELVEFYVMKDEAVLC